jgi:hypothetical protein
MVMRVQDRVYHGHPDLPQQLQDVTGTEIDE